MKNDKDSIRRMVWNIMDRRGIALPPKPIYGRIPNFVGADKAAYNLMKIKDFTAAAVVKVNPDSPQRPVRELVLRLGKVLIMPTPRIKKGFLLLDPRKISNYTYASTIRGAFKYGMITDPEELPHIDFIVEGSVAVSLECDRLGKGEGYGELEYAILLEYGKIDYDVPIATTVHEVQIVEYIPRDPYDVSINYIVTPDRVIKCRGKCRRPRGLIPELLKEEKIMEIPLLNKLIKKLSPKSLHY